MHVAPKKKAAKKKKAPASKKKTTAQKKAAPKKKTAKKAVTPIEAAPVLEAPEKKKKKASPKKTVANATDKRANTKGVWEVSLDSGVLIGYFEGTPARIASYVAYFHPEGRYIRKLNFVKMKIEKVPREIFKRKCCDKRFTTKDKYCSRCGKKLRFDLPLRKNIKLTIEVPSFRSIEKSKW